MAVTRFVDAYPLTAYQVAALGTGVSLRVEVDGPPDDEAAVRAAAEDVVRGHPALRTSVDLSQGLTQFVSAGTGPMPVRSHRTARGVVVEIERADPVLDPVAAALVAEEVVSRYRTGAACRAGEAADGVRDAVAAMVAATSGECWLGAAGRITAVA
ncbi:hypothetical protein, partial [Actinophytocola sp.]|uniref:hypothetical protein n=1 Tax=Actinophytocola sp. TaxID=1872138 RepID=UPI00389B2ED6